MGFRYSMLTRLFGAKEEKRKETEIPKSVGKEECKSRIPLPAFDGVQLELPQEHALHQLYDLRVRQAGSLLRPHLRLESCEGLTHAEQKQEARRLQRMITAAADVRLKEATPLKAQMPAESEEEQQKTTVEMDARPLIFVADNKLVAWMMILPPLGKGKELDRELLDQALKEHGVAYGVDRELLGQLPGDQKRYFHLFPIAKGKMPLHGKDGYIEEYFARTVDHKFAVDEHDRVDYTSLNLFQSIKKGEVICQAVLPTAGDPGRTVLNQEIPARDGKAMPLQKGQNTEISGDGRQLIASQDGHVEYRKNSFHVKSVLEIAGNVDYSTGNINYMGDVHIQGNICGGFRVQAMGNITVDGVVESGDVESGGDLVVGKGIVGSAKSMIRSRKNIYAKYVENSALHVRENLQADCIVNSDVYCDGEIRACSGRGIIIGGRVRAARKIKAKVIGSKMESQTSVFLGGQPCAEFERQRMEKKIKKFEAELERLERQPESPNKEKNMGKARFDWSVARMKLNQLEKERATEEETDVQGGRLECDIAYPGMLLTIGDATCRLNHETWQCKARLVDGEIKFS